MCGYNHSFEKIYNIFLSFFEMFKKIVNFTIKIKSQCQPLQKYFPNPYNQIKIFNDFLIKSRNNNFLFSKKNSTVKPWWTKASFYYFWFNLKLLFLFFQWCHYTRFSPFEKVTISLNFSRNSRSTQLKRFRSFWLWVSTMCK